MAPRSPSSSLLVTALPLSRRSSKLPWRTEAVALLARLPRGLPPLVDCSDCSRKILLLRLELLLADVAPRVALPEDVERWVGRARPPALSHQPPNRQHDADNHGAPKDERHQHHPDAPHSPHSPHRVHAPPPFVRAVLRCGHRGPHPCNEPPQPASMETKATPSPAITACLMASVWWSSMPTRQRTPARSSVRSVTCLVAE